MTMRDPHNDSENDRDRGRRDWLILLVLLLGFACLLIAAQMAVRPTPIWQVSANMLSKLNPDEDRGIEEIKIEPLRPEVMTPPPWDPDTLLTPVGTPVVVPTTVLGPPPAGTATPGAVAAVTPSPSATATAPTPSATPTTTPMPTATPVPTASPTPTPTPTTTTTPTPTPTGTPVPPTDTPVPPPTDTPTPTPTDTPIPTPPPSIFSITPDREVRTAPVPVIIQGADFFGVPTAQLGNNVSITITAASADTLTGTVPSGLTPGVYALIVTNPDAQFDVLSPAYTALNPPSPNTTLETGLLSTFGPGAPGSEGDDDHVQLIFFAVPDGTPGDLYVRIFDADTGGGGPTETLVDKPYGSYDTTITYTLYGYTDTYTDSNARSHNPNAAGISSGTPLVTQTVGANPTYHNNWGLVFGPYPASAGELAGSSRVFKLAVEGASGNDDNAYNVALSTISTTNTAPAGSRVFAYSWTFPLTSVASQWLYPYVAAGTSTFEQHNWDMDSNGTMTLHTPMRDGIAATVSGIDSGASSSHPVQTYEDGATWTVTMGPSTSWNDLTFWAVGDGSDLAIFTRPTTSAPP